MYETSEHLGRLQGVLDDSYTNGGEGQRLVLTPPNKLDAARLSTLLGGKQELELNTVSASGAPTHTKVDSVFYQGSFWFHTKAQSQAAHHITDRPYVTAACITDDDVGIVIEGTAKEVDLSAHDGLRSYWDRLFGEGSAKSERTRLVARIDAAKIFTFDRE